MTITFPRPMPQTTPLSAAVLMALALHGVQSTTEIRVRLEAWGYTCPSNSIAVAISKFALNGVLCRHVVTGRHDRYELADGAPAWAWMLRERSAG